MKPPKQYPFDEALLPKAALVFKAICGRALTRSEQNLLRLVWEAVANSRGTVLTYQRAVLLYVALLAEATQRRTNRFIVNLTRLGALLGIPKSSMTDTTFNLAYCGAILQGAGTRTGSEIILMPCPFDARLYEDVYIKQVIHGGGLDSEVSHPMQDVQTFAT